MISTVPPTPCGIATFAAALSSGLEQLGADVVYVEAGSAVRHGSKAVCALGAASSAEIAAASSALRDRDAVVLQHEYGIYPGEDGSSVVELVENIGVPVVLVAHTVLSAPTLRQHSILASLCEAADFVVVMTHVALDRLVRLYGVNPQRIVVIPHGAAVAIDQFDQPIVRPTSPLILTWGLLGPGKGIEWAIEAFARLRVAGTAPRYLIAGATHPNVKASSGESYREGLVRQAEALGVSDRIEFDDTYRSVVDLTRLIAGSDLVVLPYDSADQVTSGVLVDAVAAGRPVVSTAFPHAVELLETGAGLVVPQRDAPALQLAIEAVLNNSHLAADMAAEARRLAPMLSWPAVAASYVESIVSLGETSSQLAS